MSAAEPQAVVDAWNAMASRTGLPAIRIVTNGREANLKARLKQVGVAGMIEAIAAVERSSFCRGENNRGWRADFDFVLQPKSLVKLLEHGYQYTPRTPAATGAQQMARSLDMDLFTPLDQQFPHEAGNGKSRSGTHFQLDNAIGIIDPRGPRAAIGRDDRPLCDDADR